MNSYIKDDPTEADFIEYLNDVYGIIEICGMSMHAGEALYVTYPETFRAKYNEHCDNMNIVWVCSECGEEYTTEDEADACCDPLEPEDY